MWKDEFLDRLSEEGANVAQFVSFAPSLETRFSRIKGLMDRIPESLEEGVRLLYARANSTSLNIRTFLPEKPEGNPFEYGIQDVEKVQERAKLHAQNGLHVIV